MWILIRWLRQKPADLDLQCFKIKIRLTRVKVVKFSTRKINKSNKLPILIDRNIFSVIMYCFIKSDKVKLTQTCKDKHRT